MLKPDSYKRVIIESLQELTKRKAIAVYGYVIMPNHVHFIWEMLTKNKKEMPDSSFTKFTAHAFRKELSEHRPQFLEVFKVDKKDRAYQFWQRDPLAIRIFSKEMLQQKLRYIHLNPLSERWKLATKPEEYVWSSAGFYETGADPYGFVNHYDDRD